MLLHDASGNLNVKECPLLRRVLNILTCYSSWALRSIHTADWFYLPTWSPDNRNKTLVISGLCNLLLRFVLKFARFDTLLSKKLRKNQLPTFQKLANLSGISLQRSFRFGYTQCNVNAIPCLGPSTLAWGLLNRYWHLQKENWMYPSANTARQNQKTSKILVPLVKWRQGRTVNDGSQIPGSSLSSVEASAVLERFSTQRLDWFRRVLKDLQFDELYGQGGSMAITIIKVQIWRLQLPRIKC